MTKVVAKAVRESHPCCLIRGCREGKCKVPLPPHGTKVCFSGTHYQNNHDHESKLADCLLFWSYDRGDIAAAVELKAGRFSPTAAIEQLQNAADIIYRMSLGHAVKFFPIIAHGRRLSILQTTQLSGSRIRFGSQRPRPIAVTCGTALEDIVVRFSQQ